MNVISLCLQTLATTTRILRILRQVPRHTSVLSYSRHFGAKIISLNAGLRRKVHICLLTLPHTNVLDTDSHPVEKNGEIIPKPNNKSEEVGVLDQELFKSEVAKGDGEIPKLIELFRKWTSNEPNFELFENDDPQSFKDMLHLDPEIGRHCRISWDQKRERKNSVPVIKEGKQTKTVKQSETEPTCVVHAVPLRQVTKKRREKGKWRDPRSRENVSTTNLT